MLTDGAVGFVWPNNLFPQGAHVPIGENVIALRLWLKGKRLISVWRPHTLEEPELIFQRREEIFDTLMNHWQAMNDYHAWLR